MSEQRLGILGGMGPQATQDFYQRILDRTDAAKDQEHLPTLIWSDTSMPDRTAAILGGDAEGCYRRLLAGARLLEGGGCTVLSIPCNTSHYFADRLQEDISIPLIHMPRETVGVLAEEGRRKVAILATKRGEKGSREKFAVIDRWLRQAGCDSAILGCTELSVYRTYHGLPDHYLDAMDVLAQRCITACGYKLRMV